MIEVYPIGLLVEFIHAEGVTGKVTGVMVEGDSEVSYRVAWWNGRARSNEWVVADELQAASQGRSTIGFAQFTGNNASENVVKAQRAVAVLTEGKISKGGHNPPNTSSVRPPPPGPRR